ncbi:hypothetical protein SBF1_110030 [Candidatus Desulfosporosinus infrequens]|uniref:Uncharacterized protein n=1 Tax=Candidatus Desulfosporosinus infrequens TaxID=2043169 RepID=A0A2U3JWU1_9FIRM|nr:hypothetical protein SBF1_110030 [Candidatus Desulfosporosinus infrequens]
MPAKSVTVVTFEEDDAAVDAAEGDADAPVAGDEDVFVEEHPKRSSDAITITKISVIILLSFIFFSFYCFIPGLLQNQPF